MSTEQERSFIARIKVDGERILTADDSRAPGEPDPSLGSWGIAPGKTEPDKAPGWGGPRKIERTEGGNLLTTMHVYHEAFEEMVVARRRYGWKETLIVYFRCYDDYYNIQIRNGGYFAHFFSRDSRTSDRILGAFPPAGGKTTSFNLLDQNHNIITLDDLKSNQANVYLRARNAGVINRVLLPESKVYAFGDMPGDSIQFNLEILERNVPYPND